MKLEFDSRVFEVESVKRAAYRVADRASCEISLSGDAIVVSLFPADATVALDQLSADLRREVLDQDLRDRLSRETQQMRNLILASAFSKTALVEK